MVGIVILFLPGQLHTQHKCGCRSSGLGRSRSCRTRRCSGPSVYSHCSLHHVTSPSSFITSKNIIKSYQYFTLYYHNSPHLTTAAHSSPLYFTTILTKIKKNTSPSHQNTIPHQNNSLLITATTSSIQLTISKSYFWRQC